MNIALIDNFSYNGEKYTNHPNSVNDHFGTTLGNIENKILAVGGSPDSSSTRNNKVELFDIESNTWTTKTSFGFCPSWVAEFGVISRQSSVMIIGGYCDGVGLGSVSSLIAKYTIDKWERIGNLQQARRSHRAIENDDRIYVVGGIDTGGMDTSTLYVFLHSIIFKR